MNRHALPFLSAIFGSSSDMISMGGYFAPPPMFFPGNSSIITTSPALIQQGNSSGSFLLDSVVGLKKDTELAVEWSGDEQHILEDGLEKYKGELKILKYIKIAATLPDKIVRDVALRCRWMQDNLMESSSKMNMPSSLPQTTAAYPLMMHHLDQNEKMLSEGICGTTMHLLKQYAQTLGQITSNLSAYKLQDNTDLFCHVRNNITAMLNNMRDTPGLMSHMPPLLISVNEDLTNSILPRETNSLPQTMIFGSPSGIHLKQEPRC